MKLTLQLIWLLSVDLDELGAIILEVWFHATMLYSRFILEWIVYALPVGFVMVFDGKGDLV